jgi:WD40 repeat protein
LRLAAGSASTGEALVWDIDPRSPTYATLLARLPGHQGAVFPLRYTPDGTALLVGSGDWFGGTTKNSLNLWNVDESSPTYGTIIRAFEGLGFYPRAFAFTPDSHYLLVGTQNVSSEGEFIMWDMLTGAHVTRLQTGPDVSSILVSADGTHACGEIQSRASARSASDRWGSRGQNPYKTAAPGGKPGAALSMLV